MFWIHLKRLWYFFKIEFFIVFIINVILMVFTYLFKGVGGVENIIKSLNEQYDGVGLSTTLLSFLIGLILWFFYYFFNFKHKNILGKVSEGLIDTLITLLRLAGGILFAFTLLYLIVDGFTAVLIAFLYYGSLAIIESSLLVLLKNKMYSRPERTLL